MVSFEKSQNIYRLYSGSSLLNRVQTTGFAFFYKKRWIVMTAAHGVFDHSLKKVNDRISIKKNSFSSLILHKEWVEKKNYMYDIAFLLPEDDNFFEKKANKFVELVTDDIFFKKCSLVGYPVFSWQKKKYSSIVIKDLKFYTKLFGIKAKVKDGLSGSPCFITDDLTKVIGSVSLSFDKYPGVLWCVPITQEIKAMVDELLVGESNNSVILKIN